MAKTTSLHSTIWLSTMSAILTRWYISLSIIPIKSSIFLEPWSLSIDNLWLCLNQLRQPSSSFCMLSRKDSTVVFSPLIDDSLCFVSIFVELSSFLTHRKYRAYLYVCTPDVRFVHMHLFLKKKTKYKSVGNCPRYS